MKTYAVWNGKGGVGKTITTSNLAYELSLRGIRVLVIDIDPQTNATPAFTKANENGRTIVNVLENTDEISKCIYRTKYESIDIIKGNTYLTESHGSASDHLLYQAIHSVEDKYDVVLIDCRPSFEALTRNALYAADVLITPIILDGFCKDNLALVRRLYDNLVLERIERPLEWIVFVNRVKNLRSQKQIYQELLQKYDYPLTNTCVSDRAAVPNASRLRKMLKKHAAKDATTKDFEDLTSEIFGELVHKEG